MSSAAAMAASVRALAVFQTQANEAGDEIADGDAGEDAEDADVGPVEMGEGGEEHLMAKRRAARRTCDRRG